MKRLLRVWGVALGLGLGWGGVASAVDVRVPVLSEGASVEEKVQRFRAWASENADMLAAIDAAEEAGVPLRDRIHEVLLATESSYAEAFEAYEASGDNVDDWRGVLENLGKESPYVEAHATYFLGRALMAQDDLEAASRVLERVRGEFVLQTPWQDSATLYLAFAYAQMPERRDAPASGESRAARLLGTLVGEDAVYSGVPERVQEGARWLQRELDGRGSGPLLELARQMSTIERLIDRGRTGEDTQTRQQELLDEIDRLIALLRERESNCSGGGGGGGGGGGQGGGGNAGGNQRSGGPAQRSTLPGGESRIGELSDAERRMVEDWGTLGEREREEAMQFLRERFPSRYREIIERYYRAVAEEDD